MLPRPTSLTMTYLPTFSGLRGVALRAALFHQTARGIHVVRCHQVRSCTASRIAAAKMPAMMSSSIIPSPPRETVIGLPDRPGLEDVEKAEQHESAGQPIPIGRSCQHRHGISRDLVPDDPRVIVHTEPARALPAQPDAADGARRWRRPDATAKPNCITPSTIGTATSVPNVPGARGARPEPKPNASRWTGLRSNAGSALHRPGGFALMKPSPTAK